MSLIIQTKFYIESIFKKLTFFEACHILLLILGGDEAEIYRNRKGFYSINVQLIGDSNLKIQDIVARWPGSQHDNTIFDHSYIKARFEEGEFRNSVLLGNQDLYTFLVPML